MKDRLDLIVCAAIAYIGPKAWLDLVFGGGGTLADNGVSSLKYFTVLSNLFAAFACVVYLIDRFSRRGERRARTSTAAQRLKFAGAVAVMLTFLVVVTFLGPLYTYKAMFKGGNLHLHLTVPLLSFLDVCFLDDRMDLDIKSTFLAVIPPAVYGIAYRANIFINGRGEWPDTNDWYSFAMWGKGVMMVILVVLALITWLMAVGMLILHNWQAADDLRVHRR